MKRILIIAVLATTTLTFTACATSEKTTATSTTAATASPGENVEQVLTQIEQNWATLATKHDKAASLAAFDQDVAEDWSAISWDGQTYAQFTRAQAIANIKSDAGQVESVTVDGIKVRANGDTAIVTYYSNEKSKFQGRDTSGRYFNTDVFVKRAGHWQVIAGHASRVEAPKQ